MVFGSLLVVSERSQVSWCCSNLLDDESIILYAVAVIGAGTSEFRELICLYCSILFNMMNRM